MLDLMMNLGGFDYSGMVMLLGWSIVNKSPYPKRNGNESGQIRNIAPHSSISLPNDDNYMFWDADTNLTIMSQRQVIINKDGYFE